MTCLGLGLALGKTAWLAAAEAPAPWNTVQPLLEDRCYDCHGGIKTKGGVNLVKLKDNPQIKDEYPLWEKIQEVIGKGEMPPKKADPLSASEKSQLLHWVTQSLDFVANENAGDPGPVTMRRLSNAEYETTMRDLTGQDYHLTGEFPADGGGGEGFSNTGDVLFVSSQLLDKYLAAARHVADSASILPGTGIVFHSQHVGLRGPEQWKAQAEQALYVWYQHKAEPFLPKDEEDLREADYMLACWKYQHRDVTGATSLEQLAKDGKLSAPFLQNWWNMLNSTKPASRFLDLTRLPWRELPAPDKAKPQEIPAAVQAACLAIQDQRRSWYQVKRKGQSSVQRMQQDADGLRPYPVIADVTGKSEAYLCVGDDGDGNKGDLSMVSDLLIKTDKGYIKYFDYLTKTLQESRDRLKKLENPPTPANSAPNNPAAPNASTMANLREQIATFEKLLARFGKHPQHPVDPQVLTIAAPEVVTLPLPKGARQLRGSCKLDLSAPDAEFATIQWALRTDKPLDVTKIMPGVLTLWKRQTKASGRTMADFEVMRMAFPDLYERRLEEVARNFYRGSPGPGVYYFSDDQLATLLTPAEKEELRQMKTDWIFTSVGKLDAKKAQGWDQLVETELHKFAAQAWRRALTPEEEAQLNALYAAEVSKDIDRETAAREVLVRVLVSPNFLFKAETLPAAANVAAAPANKNDLPLSSWELASRLSYFLWASMPDDALRAAAGNGSLLQPAVLDQQVQRMLQSPKASALARLFAGQWLQFDGFASYNGVDEKKYPEFTPEIRADLYQETLTFFEHFVHEDRPVSEIISADYTYLNPRLAKYYGIPGVQGSEDTFQKVSVSAYHRGGLLGMASVLTKTSRPHRTSPVLRGNWLLQTVLGTPVPPPPNNVPKLREGGAKPATVREMLKLHRADAACASCHARIDPLGFALEDFDAVGRLRAKDESGLPIDDSAEYPGSANFAGPEGLRTFLKSRDDQFVNQFDRKLLGYALGRQVLPTDKALMQQMLSHLKANGQKFSSAVLTVVHSRQFLNRRNESAMASNP